jgi:hypothetical protein
MGPVTDQIFIAFTTSSVFLLRQNIALIILFPLAALCIWYGVHMHKPEDDDDQPFGF